MNCENPIKDRDELRARWRAVRTARLELKAVFFEKEPDNAEIKNKVRNHSDYKRLKKEQKYISKMIKHIENKICREMKNEA